MKESNFYSDEFEQLLREKTEQYKMYPSEKVWKGIHSSLHTKRRWFITGMSLLITGILFFAGRELLSPSRAELAKRSAAAAHNRVDAAGSFDDNASPLAAVSGQHHSSSSAVTGRRSGQNSDDQSYKEINVGLSDPAVMSQHDISEMLSQVVALPAEPPSIPLIAVIHMPTSTGGVTEEGMIAQTNKTGAASGTISGTMPAVNGPVPTDRSVSFVSTAPGSGTLTENTKDADAPARTPRVMGSKNSLATTRSTAEPVAGNGSVDSSRKSAGGTVIFTDAIADQQRINWLYDYAVYNLPAAAKRGRKYFQLYFSPTATYRNLSGGIITSKPGPNVPSPKDYLNQGPALGFELGSTIMYRLTRNLTVKAGLQFNYSRVSFKAYANAQPSSGSISTPYGYALDTLHVPPGGFMPNGKSQISLTNDNYQLSAPIGFELRVMGNERLQLNVGATIQPSYLLNTSAYYLTSDFTNYTKEPSQFRRWNLTGSVEAFLSYKLHNGLRLQAGPEFRYQLLSSFHSSYLIQENLKGYGFKIGIVKAIP